MRIKILIKKFHLKNETSIYGDHITNIGYFIHFTMNRIGNNFHEYGLDSDVFEDFDENYMFANLRESKTNPTIGKTFFNNNKIVFWKLGWTNTLIWSIGLYL